MELENLKQTWEESKKHESQKELTMEQLTQILNARTDTITSKMKKGIWLSIGLNMALMAGAINILISYSSDVISLAVGLVTLAVLIMFLIFSIGQYGNINAIEQGKGSIREMLIKRINFFRTGYRWVVLSIALSGAFVYIIGSTTYFGMKYGEISLDSTDLMVHGIFLFLALVIGLVANTKEHNQYLSELELCMANLENKEVSPTPELTKIQKNRRIYLILAGVGLLLLILIIFLLAS